MPKIINNIISPVSAKAVPELVTQINTNIVNNSNFNFKNIQDQFAPMSTLQELSAGTKLNHTVSVVEVVGNGGAITLTATPTITEGYAGERILIIGTSDANTVTFQDESALSGSTLQLSGGASKTLGAGDTLELIYSTTVGAWLQISNSNN
jgi:hypothetical protein